MSSSTADTVDRARARSRARGSLDDLIAGSKGKEQSKGSEQTSSAAETWTGSSPYGGVGKSKGKSKGKSEELKGKGKGKSKGSKGVAGGGSDSYGNTGKDGAGGGDDNDEEEEEEERERTGLTAAVPTASTSKWEYVLMRVKDAQSKTEDALEILDKLETQLMDI